MDKDAKKFLMSLVIVLGFIWLAMGVYNCGRDSVNETTIPDETTTTQVAKYVPSPEQKIPQK